MQVNNNNNQLFATQQTILGALCVILALVGGCWFLAYRVYTTAPTTEVIAVTLPPEMVASKGLAEPLQVIQVEREKPERKWFSALLHPLGFGVLLLVIISAGGGMILLVIWLDGGARDG